MDGKGSSRRAARRRGGPRRWGILVAVLAAPACLEVEETVVLRADGSGTQHLRLLASDRGVRALAAYAEGVAGPGPDAVERIFEPEIVLAELREAGLARPVAAVHERGRRRQLDARAEFASLEQLAGSPLGGGRAEWRLSPGERAGTVRLVVFPRGEEAWRKATERAAAMTGELGAAERAYFARTKERMRGLSVQWTLELPGDVLAHGAGLERDGARAVVARVTDADLRTPRDLVRSLAPRYEVVFDARGCRLPAGGR